VNRWQLISLHLLVYGAAAGVFSASSHEWVWSFLVLPNLIWISVVDFERYEIPDPASLLLLFLAALRLIFMPGLPGMDYLFAGLLAPLVFWAVSALYAFLRGRQGLGFGDVKLMAGIGFLVGSEGTVFVVLTSSLSGILTLLAISLRHRTPISEVNISSIAFGPFLCLSTWVAWLQGL
jgi:leader peptidase (prepilin peptidase) / N-methyltransferase